MSDLPTAEQLQRLPLRAIAAYAARAAHRLRAALQGKIDEQILQRALSVVEAVASAEQLDRRDAVSAVLAGSEIVGVGANLGSSQERLCVLGINSATRTASAVLQGTAEPEGARYYAAYAARAAVRAANMGDVLDEPLASAAMKAARRDYETLRRVFGEHDTVTVGEPIDISEKSLLGPLM